MNKSEFGVLKDGRKAYLYSIENSKIKMSVTDYGASLVSLIIKEKNRDVIQGFTQVSGYQDEVRYMGATVGRVCNRIKNGTFLLNDKEYHVPVNNGPNSLHGGEIGFSDTFWNIEMLEDSIIATLFSPDGEQGYPGNLALTVTYQLLEDGISYSYRGSSDQDTLLNITNHAFFNLSGPTSETVLDHEVQSNALTFMASDCDGLSYGPVINVQNTAFDFRKKKRVDADLFTDDEQIVLGNGYDHHFNVDGIGVRELVSCSVSDLKMTVLSDLPGFQMYSGNFLDGMAIHGKEGATFPKRSSICFETQYIPNAINICPEAAPILRADEIMRHTTEYHFLILD